MAQLQVLAVKGETLRKKNISILIFGDEARGKTSLALSTKNTLLIGFDGGEIRATIMKSNKDIFPIAQFAGELSMNAWEYYKQIGGTEWLRNISKDYDTIVIDTVGFAQMAIIDYLQSRKQYGTDMQMYGDLIKEFKPLVTTLLNCGKNIIFLAHSETKTKNKKEKSSPQIVGQLKSFISAQADLICYLVSGNKGEFEILFNSCEFADLKNPAMLKDSVIPDFNIPENRLYMQSIIDKTLEVMNKMTDEQIAAMEKLNKLRLEIDSLDTLESHNAYIKERYMKLKDKTEMSVMWNILNNHAKNLGFEYNKDKVNPMFILTENQNG